jgi:hypothetical protein
MEPGKRATERIRVKQGREREIKIENKSVKQGMEGNKRVEKKEG